MFPPGRETCSQALCSSSAPTIALPVLRYEQRELESLEQALQKGGPLAEALPLIRDDFSLLYK